MTNVSKKCYNITILLLKPIRKYVIIIVFMSPCVLQILCVMQFLFYFYKMIYIGTYINRCEQTLCLSTAINTMDFQLL